MNDERQKAFNQLNQGLNNINHPNYDTVNQLRERIKENTKNSQLRLKSPIVVALILLYHSAQTYTYDPITPDNASLISDASDSSTLHTLTSLNLAQIVHSYKKDNSHIICQVTLTKLGRQLVQKFIPQHEIFYKQIKSKRRNNNFMALWIITYWILCISFVTSCFFLINFGSMKLEAGISSLITLFSLLVIILMGHSTLTSSYTNLVNKCSEHLTKSNVMNFLKQHHIPKLNYKFEELSNTNQSMSLNHFIFSLRK